MNIRRSLSIAGAFLVTASALVATNAAADTRAAAPSPPDSLAAVLVDSPPADGVKVIDDLTGVPGTDVPVLDQDANAAVTRVVSGDTENQVNTVVWDAESDVLRFYVHGQDDRISGEIARTVPADQKWEIVSATRSRPEIEALVERIARDPGVLGADVTFVSGAPSPDGASISIGVSGGDLARKDTSLAAQVDGVALTYHAEEPSAELYTRIGAQPPVVAGGRTVGANGGSCTAGFPVQRYADNQPNTLTADHCESAQGVPWGWGNQGSIIRAGVSTFQAPGGTDLELYSDNDALSPWIFVGDHNNANAVLPIRGYYAPVGGNSVCYSGAATGIVCGNVVENADVLQCDAFPAYCYWRRWTTQTNGIPAAGSGDSGGPVAVFFVRPNDNTIGAFGIGIISRGANSTTNCTGDPGVGGRVCSSNVAFAPLNRWTGAQSTHRLVGTTF